MTTKQITVNVYEIGDVLRLADNAITSRSKKKAFGDSEKVLIIGVKELVSGFNSYWAIAENGKKLTIKQSEILDAKCVDHIDLKGFFNDSVDAE